MSEDLESFLARLNEIQAELEAAAEFAKHNKRAEGERYDKVQFVAANYVPAHAYVSRGFKQADGAPVAWLEQESFVPKEQWRVEQWHRLYAVSLQGLRAHVGPFGLTDESGIRLPVAETAKQLQEIATADADAAYGPLNGDAK